jgi:hypothetical protein
MGLLCKRVGSYNWLTEWGFILDPIIRKTYISEGELDQVENTVNFAKKPPGPTATAANGS